MGKENNNEIFYHDGTQLDGYRCIKRRDEDSLIWIDCPIEYIPVIVDALNDKAVKFLQRLRRELKESGLAGEIDDFLIQLSYDRHRLINNEHG